MLMAIGWSSSFTEKAATKDVLSANSQPCLAPCHSPPNRRYPSEWRRL